MGDVNKAAKLRIT